MLDTPGGFLTLVDGRKLTSWRFWLAGSEGWEVFCSAGSGWEGVVLNTFDSFRLTCRDVIVDHVLRYK